MKQSNKTSLALTDDELGILDAIAARRGISRNEVMRHLIIYQGCVGGDFPLTSKILGLPEAGRRKVVATIREKAEKGEFLKPSAFMKYIAEAVGSEDPAEIEQGIDTLVRRLMEG